MSHSLVFSPSLIWPHCAMGLERCPSHSPPLCPYTQTHTLLQGVTHRHTQKHTATRSTHNLLQGVTHRHTQTHTDTHRHTHSCRESHTDTHRHTHSCGESHTDTHR